MVRKRVKGRFAKEGAETLPEQAGDGPKMDEAQQGGEGLVGAPRPKNCRVYTRARFAEALPEVTKTLLREAKKGSVAHLKLLVQISGLDKGDVAPARPKRRGRNLEEILMEEWKKEHEGHTEAEKRRRAEGSQAGEGG